ncbi:unnamed protein product [Rhizophagus irregularis]|nr:unnamed protein product [Rhizophagus irregularis]
MFYNVSFLGPALKSRTPFHFILKWTKINFEFFSFRGEHFKGRTHFKVKMEPCNVEPYHTHKAPVQSIGLSSTSGNYLFKPQNCDYALYTYHKKIAANPKESNFSKRYHMYEQVMSNNIKCPKPNLTPVL